MREIKFRAWDKEHNTMRYGILPFEWDFAILTGAHKCVRHRDEDGWARFEINAITCDGKNVMQYTGLKDKNGKEIYEGDLLKFEDDRIYGNNIVQLHIHNLIEGDSSYTASEIKRASVIGNIYENRELLNV